MNPAASVSMADADPVGWYMAGSLLRNTPEQVRTIAVEQRILAELDGDTDDAHWWAQVLIWLDAQAALAARVARMPKAVR